MIGQAGGWRRWALALAAGGLLLASVGSLRAQSGGSIPWGPSRDEAVLVSETVLVDEEEAIGSGVRGVPGSAQQRSLRVQRPARLLPRAGVGQMHEQYIEGPPVIEELAVPPGMEQHYAGSQCETCGGPGGVNCCGNWNSCGPVSPCCLLPCPRLDAFEVHGGVQGFTGPANRGGSGSFGFYEGFNHATGLCNDCFCGQFGGRWTQSNFDGSLLTSDERQQTFLTAGIFRRVDWGLQCGVVFDYLHDEWDYEVDLGQVRGEVGWKYCGCHELGFRFSAGTSDDRATINELFQDDDDMIVRQRNAAFEVNDLYAFYYRRQFQCGGEGRLFGGFTNNDQGLVGGDVRVPLNPCWSLQADFLYVVPTDDSTFGYAEESWNVAVGVVWTPFAKPGCPAYCRPLFDVANNGTLATVVR